MTRPLPYPFLNKIKPPTELSRMINARKNLLLDKPFWGTTALRLILRELDNLPAVAGTNGKYLFFNSIKTRELNKKQLMTIIAHEVGHLIYLHHLRRNNRDKRHWNIAGDFAVNGILRNDGFEFPDYGCLDSKFDGMNAEKIYEIIHEETEILKQEMEKQAGTGDNSKDGENQNGKGQNDQDGDDQNDGDNQNDGDDGDNQDDENLDDEDQDNQDQSDDDGDKDDNAIPGGHDQFGKLDDPDPGGMGMVEDWPGENPEENPTPPSPSEIKHEEQNWKVFTNQALQQAISFGNIPGGLEREIEKLLTPKVDWNEQLRNFVYEKIKDNYTWKFPNRKYIQGGIYMPNLNGETIKNLVVTIDTSGSINAQQLTQAATELTSILETFNVYLHVLYCDTEIANHEEFSSVDLPVKLNARGFGGTDFRPPFEWVEKNLDELPICLIYITDLQCDQFPDIPEYPVLWICTGNKDYIWYKKPPFGDVVYVEVWRRRKIKVGLLLGAAYPAGARFRTKEDIRLYL